jgi:phage terminase large subunit
MEEFDGIEPTLIPLPPRDGGIRTKPQKKGAAEFPEKLACLFEKHRYKILYGGRGGAKSWGIARALLIQGAQRPLRILCARELQKSIRDSVHKLLSDQVKFLGLEAHYHVQQNTIRGINGTEFFFEGLCHNSGQIKSYEGIDIVWVEEAAFTSKSSWDFLIPTIRKSGSEIWISFNPELEEDETYQRFVLTPPTNSVVVKLSFRDNPWFTAELRQEMEDLKARNYEDYKVVWEGFCRQTVEGAIYADEMRDAAEDGRIMRVPHNPALVVNTFWDLGYSDMTSIWFVQKSGLEYNIIDFYQNSRKAIQHYAKVLQEKKYIYGHLYLPHDAVAHHLATGKSVEEVLIALGHDIEIIPKLSIPDGLSAVRTVFPLCRFDKENCADGLTGLRRYKYKVDPDTNRTSKLPDHDINSHAADGFRYFATAPEVQWDVVVDHHPIHGTVNKPGKCVIDYDVQY